MDNIIFAFVHSIWNDGEYDIISSCKVNLTDSTVFDIVETTNPPNNLNKLNAEYVELPGGEIRKIVYDKNLRGDGSIFCS